MSNRVKSPPRAGSSGAGMPPKAERRAAAKLAAAKRATARRRNRILKQVGSGIAVLAVVVGVAAACGAFEGSKPAATSQPSPSAVPVALDPAMSAKPVVTKGEGALTELKVTTLIEGKGAPVQAGQTISVKYVGVSYRTGVEFDSSWKPGDRPYTFQVGAGGVIDGWDQGLPGVKVGSRVQLDIPADLAYGENPTDGRPPGPLRFVVDVLP